MINRYAWVHHERVPQQATPQPFFELTQDAIDKLAGRRDDGSLLVAFPDASAAAAIGTIAALMDVRVSLDALALAVRELTDHIEAATAESVAPWP